MKSRPLHITKIINILCLFAIIFGLFSAYPARGETVDEIKRNIELKNVQIEALNKEIKELDTKIQGTTKQGQTLKGAINTLDASKNKITKEIDVTQNRVGTTNLNIEKIGLEITDKEKKIQRTRQALADSLRDLKQAEDVSLVESVFKFKNISELWNQIENLNRFHVSLQNNMSSVENLKNQLSEKKVETEAQKLELLKLKTELEDQKKIVDINKSEKAKLLSATQSQEAIYKKQLAEKVRLSEAFLKEISTYEAQLRFIIDPNSYPVAGSGILSWPLESVVITQQFGDTAFARTNAYNGKGHNGVDFGVSRGSKVMSSLSGTVAGTGNTDAVPGCYSYGKWVLINHDNGLSTLYAHLDLIKVVAGQRVDLKETIGYSGNTGYSTGPHLHFGVYATQGVKIVKYENSINCKNAIIPVADIRAYLNPLLYL